MPHARTRRTLAGTLALAVFALAPLWGCATERAERIRIDPPMIADARVAGPAIDVENFRGDVIVRIDPRVREIDVRHTLRIDGDVEREDREMILAHESVTVETDEAHDLPIVRVRSTTVRPSVEGHRVDVRITAPAAGGVRVRVGEGRIILIGVAGAIHAELDEGPIEVRTATPIADPVALTTGKGNIRLQIARGSTGLLDVDAGEGRAVLENASPYDRIERHEVRGSRYTCVLNGGENPVMLRTGDGVAAINVLERPTERVRIVR
ncbi:MAG: hypothetical protein EA379_09345 [Phycisphaerales bacterium]|nr:MAG: hypothetical protein EA379_09345 [Phycisphaerales bacterium]